MAVFRRILFPVDFSGRSTEAVRHVLFWARRFGSTIFASHLVDPVEYIGQQRSRSNRVSELRRPSLDFRKRVVPVAIETLDHRSTLSAALAGDISGDHALNAYDGTR